MYKIKYLITGHVFVLPEDEAKKLKEKYPDEYQILEKNGKKYRDKVVKKKKEIDLKNIRNLVVEDESKWWKI